LHVRDGPVSAAGKVVIDGEVIWLADGFHRVYGHDEAGLTECEAVIHAGTKLDAIRLSLSANAEHGRARTESDLKNAYKRACQFGLVDPGDAEAVRRLLACSTQTANRFTYATRAAREAERNRTILELKAQGLSNPAIGADERVNLSESGVRKVLGKGTPSYFGSMSESASAAPAEPEQIDLEDAIGGATSAPDPVAAYEEERKAEARQREMWGEVLSVLQSFARLPARAGKEGASRCRDAPLRQISPARRRAAPTSVRGMEAPITKRKLLPHGWLVSIEMNTLIGVPFYQRGSLDEPTTAREDQQQGISEFFRAASGSPCQPRLLEPPYSLCRCCQL
jgi:hypothetical protein